MTDRNCNTGDNYKPSDRYYDSRGVQKTPEIRAFTQEQFDKAKSDKATWKRVLYNYWNDGWILAGTEWEGINKANVYGLPVTDPFWKEWEEMQKLKRGSNICPKKDTCADYIPDENGMCLDKVESYPCYFKKQDEPLVKVWSIDNSGNVTEKELYGQPDWDEVKRENKGAEAIVVYGDSDAGYRIFAPDGAFFSHDYMALSNKEILVASQSKTPRDTKHGMMAWYYNNPVESIRTEIIKRNAPKFKMRDWVKPLNSTSYPYQITDEALLSLANGLPHRLSTRSDFDVKRVGPDGLEHTWLAVDYSEAKGVTIYKDGGYVGWFLNDSDFMKLLNLPVCPAEVK